MTALSTLTDKDSATLDPGSSGAGVLVKGEDRAVGALPPELLATAIEALS